MSETRRPICFVATAKPEEAAAFYGDVLGLALVSQSPYALVYADGDTMLRVQIVAALEPAEHTVHGWQVDDIHADIAALSARGVQFLQFSHLGTDDAGVWTTPGGNKIVWFHDPCGNILSLTEFGSP